MCGETAVDGCWRHTCRRVRWYPVPPYICVRSCAAYSHLNYTDSWRVLDVRFSEGGEWESNLQRHPYTMQLIFVLYYRKYWRISWNFCSTHVVTAAGNLNIFIITLSYLSLFQTLFLSLCSQTNQLINAKKHSPFLKALLYVIHITHPYFNQQNGLITGNKTDHKPHLTCEILRM
jgi:hypothetical protein